MTGPQFQVKLPKFLGRNSGTYSLSLEGENWLKEVREDLLGRRYE